MYFYGNVNIMNKDLIRMCSFLTICDILCKMSFKDRTSASACTHTGPHVTISRHDDDKLLLSEM